MAGSTTESGPVLRIYGKDGCPHTRRARDAWPEAEFLDVLANPLLLDEMLRLTNGVRRIPVIVRAGAVEIGFKRGA
ncbi:MAG: glutaredoxin [Deltaproteobacteria bacterium HGW-Deltaproteobacteria-8]|jgi:glutaredoxin 3|nr:MAG: glutaredoxin [Deltaproteobacteria bacterium HGW-Deltaproteobacteria-8]